MFSKFFQIFTKISLYSNHKSINMRKILFILLLLSALSCNNNSSQEQINDVTAADTLYEFGIPVSIFDVKEGEVQKGQFFANLMYELGADNNQIYSLEQECKGKFDLKKFKIGSRYKAYYTTDDEPKLAYLLYQNDKKSFVTFRIKDTISVNITELETTSVLKVGETTIKNSLWLDMQASGINPLLAIKLSDIYAWSIDFFGLREGDSFRVLYEEIYVGDKFLDIGAVYASEFTHMNKVYKSYYFTQDSLPGYWNEKGENMQKAFLKAPLNFTRISSRFTYSRMHPVTRVVRPHTGIDYAAPKGTPVVTIGDGMVVEKGYKGGGGHTVKIKHNGTYSTAYLHLSKYGSGISKGVRVRQGQVIGYVGSTGLSTGPHLDFRVWKNGKPINPLTMESPPAKKLNDSQKAEYFKYIKSMDFKRDSIDAENIVSSIISGLGSF